MTTVPSDEGITAQIRAVVSKARKDGTEGELTMRTVRTAVEQHFELEEGALNERKKMMKEIVQEALEEDEPEAAERGVPEPSSIPASPSSKKPSSSKQAPHKRKASAEGGGSDIPSNKGSARKKARPSSAVKVEDVDENVDEDVGVGGEEEGKGEGEDEGKGPVAGNGEEEGGAKESEDAGLDDGSESETSLQEDESIKEKATKTKGKRSKKAESDPKKGQLKRLRGLFNMAQGPKRWTKIFQDKGVSDNVNGQIRVVKQMLLDLGMTTPFSQNQAKKIREERDFANELEAIQAEAPRTSGTRGGRASRSKARTEAEDESEEDDAQPAGRRSFKNSLAAFAAELNSDDD